jgi:hypothetical protein
METVALIGEQRFRKGAVEPRPRPRGGSGPWLCVVGRRLPTGHHPYNGTFNRVAIRSEKRRPTLGRRGSLGHPLLAHEVKIDQAPVVGPELSPRSGFGSTRG